MAVGYRPPSIENSETEVAPLARRLADLDAQRSALLAAAPRELPDDVRALHQKASAVYRVKVQEIVDTLAKGDAAAAEVVERVRGLIKRIIFRPGPDGRRELDIEAISP